MNIKDAIDIIESWVRTQDETHRGFPRTLRAMCVGAEPPDVPEIVPLLLSQARRYMAQGAVALNLDHRCPPNSECDRLGGCRAYVREAECYSALSVALRCMEKHGPNFPGADWPESGRLADWLLALAAANGIQLKPLTPPVVRIFNIPIAPGENPLEKLIEEQTGTYTKPTLQ